MPNDNRQMGTTHQRAILYELKQIKELLQEGNDIEVQFKKILALQELGIEHQKKIMKEKEEEESHGACCRNGCEKCEQ